MNPEVQVDEWLRKLRRDDTQRRLTYARRRVSKREETVNDNLKGQAR